MDKNRRLRDRESRRPGPQVLVAGFGARKAGDASMGLIAADRMAEENWPEEIDVMTLEGGPIEAAIQLGHAGRRYERLVLLGGVTRGRVSGRLYVRRLTHPPRLSRSDETDLDRLIAAAEQSGSLPEEVITIELESVHSLPEEELSERSLRLLPEMMRRAGQEAIAPRRRPPVTAPRTGTAAAAA